MWDEDPGMSVPGNESPSNDSRVTHARERSHDPCLLVDRLNVSISCEPTETTRRDVEGKEGKGVPTSGYRRCWLQRDEEPVTLPFVWNGTQTNKKIYF